MGVFARPAAARAPARMLRDGWRSMAQTLVEGSIGKPMDGGLELHLYESVALRDGRHADNPWLQELPDPISKVTWGNVAAVSPSLAARLGLVNGDLVTLQVRSQ